jgi:hypothetical protein
MDLLELPLNQMPYHLDILAFWATALLIGLGGAFAIKRLSDAIGRTDTISTSGLPPAAETVVRSVDADSGSRAPAVAATPAPQPGAASVPHRLAA